MIRSTLFAAGLALGVTTGAGSLVAAQDTPAQGTPTQATPDKTGGTTTAGTLTPNAPPQPARTATAEPTAEATSPSGPAKGANSFTEGQAQSRISDAGFSDVAALKKDEDGIWHGTAMKSGQQVQVWLDYKGDVGQQ